jgi:hypothetical protein
MSQTPQTQNARTKAAKVKCSVKILGNGRYLVTTPEQHRYVVRMEMRDDKRYAVCHCGAASFDKACLHVVHAANVDDLRVDGRLTRKAA